MITTEERRKIGKRNKINGAIFERNVRKDLEAKGWIVDRWTNNLELPIITDEIIVEGMCSFAKTNRFNMRTTGFPDFIAMKPIGANPELYFIKFIECKTNGKLDKIEKEKARWYLDNNYCSKFLIAYKEMIDGKVVVNYKEFK